MTVSFRQQPFSPRTQAVLDAVVPGEKAFWFDCDGTITRDLDQHRELRPDLAPGTATFGFGYACAFLGLVEDRYGHYLTLQRQLAGTDPDRRLTYDGFFGLVELECIIRAVDEGNAIVRHLDITASELANLRRERGLEHGAPIPMDAGLMTFLGYKMGVWMCARGLYDTETLSLMHHIQTHPIGPNHDQPVHTDVVTLAVEDFNRGLTHAVVDHYNQRHCPTPPLAYPRHVLGKQVCYGPDGSLQYAYDLIPDDAGAVTMVRQDMPEYLRKWYLLEVMEARGQHVIGVAGDNLRPGGSDDAGLYLARDEDGNPIAEEINGVTTYRTAGRGGLGVGGSYLTHPRDPETGRRMWTNPETGAYEESSPSGTMTWVLREVARLRKEPEAALQL